MSDWLQLNILQEAGLDEESIARRKAAQKAHEDFFVDKWYKTQRCGKMGALFDTDGTPKDEWNRRLKEAAIIRIIGASSHFLHRLYSSRLSNSRFTLQFRQVQDKLDELQDKYDNETDWLQVHASRSFAVRWKQR